MQGEHAHTENDDRIALPSPAGSFGQIVVDLVRSRAESVRKARTEVPLKVFCHERAAWRWRMPAEVLVALDAGVETKRLLPGEAICEAGCQPTGWIGVIDGFLVRQADDRYSDRPACGLPPGAWYGEEELLASGMTGHRIVAVVSTQVAVLRTAVFQHLIDEQPAFGRLVLEIQAERMAALRRRALWPQKLGTNAGVALQLADLFVPEMLFDGNYYVPLTQSGISSFVRLSRQRTNEALNCLERIGEVELRYGSMNLRSPTELTRRVLAGEIK